MLRKATCSNESIAECAKSQSSHATVPRPTLLVPVSTNTSYHAPTKSCIPSCSPGKAERQCSTMLKALGSFVNRMRLKASATFSGGCSRSSADISQQNGQGLVRLSPPCRTTDPPGGRIVNAGSDPRSPRSRSPPQHEYMPVPLMSPAYCLRPQFLFRRIPGCPN